jgi:FkbM family methyltransferase
MTRTDRNTLTAATISLLSRRTHYLEPELSGLSDVVETGGVCVDVGAAAGIYTAALSHLVGPSGRVHSVEPLAFAHPLWTRLLHTRAAPNVTHHPVALGAEPGTATMSVPVGRYGPVTGRSFLAWKTSGLGSNTEFATQVDVVAKVNTLDALCAGFDRLDFVKIDVEGGELDVLRGGRHVIDAFRPALLIEIEARHISRYAHTPADVTDWLLGRGYTMHVWHRGWQPTSSVCAHARNYLFQPR